ncbi:thiolase family protein [Rhodococcus sp. T2V]|uniref:thiolase family protein n=1 Tax=Rhodococcus sp. T2V TaxID=3034164 RepID=UPI0023E22B25|nr:thiolase family protein [Rhodococcus sp. T2V]MDF3309657.1 thiolase family protein [Rhodococcus sp. T2V]
MKARYPIQDQVAIVGVGTTEYSRDSGKSELGLVAEASRAAIRDAGLTAKDIDGIAGSWVRAELVQGALGIPAVNYYLNTILPPFQGQVIAGMNAVFAGLCETVLVYHSGYRTAVASRSAAADPFRVPRRSRLRPLSPMPDTINGTVCYATWADRYLHEYGATREDLGLIAINNRSNAVHNDHAVQRDPLTMEGYLAGRMIREPLNLFDMDYPVDGSDALVITTAERARDLTDTPVLLHVAVDGQTSHAVEEDMPDLTQTGLKAAADNLWARTDLSLDDVDVYMPYDGFSIIQLKWFESIGYCGVGEAPAFLKKHWNADENRIEINGRVLVNPHGGSLSEGASQGAGHIREAVRQLRGQGSGLQVEGAKTALVTPGGFFYNAGALLLRTES